MTTIRNPETFLRRVLIADAVAGAVAGLALLAGAGAVADLLGMPASLLRYAGAALLPVAAFIAFVATRARLPRAGVWIIIAVNALWTVESLILLFSGWVHPTLAGQVFIVAQALMVAGFAELEFIGLRRTAPRAIAA